MAALSLTAAPPSVSLTTTENGQQKEWRLAFDELAWVGRPAAITAVPGVNSLADLRARAREQRDPRLGEPALVWYPAHGPRIESTRRLLLPRVAARLAPAADPRAIAAATVATEVRPVAELPGWWLFEVESSADAVDLAAQLAVRAEVREVSPQLARQHARKLIPSDPDFWQLWHLRNTGLNQGTVGVDIQITDVWDAWRGEGMVIGIVDDGVQGEHPDLAANFSAALSTNLNQGGFNLMYDDHGTRVAGAAAARGNNGIGVTGVAFEAKLASIRLLSEFTTDATDAKAMLHRHDAIPVMNNSWGTWDSDGIHGTLLDGPGPLMAEALATGTSAGRGGLGTVYVFAGGNGRAAGENVNYDGFANNVNVIAVGAVSDRGEQSSFSEPGACLVVSAPSGSGREFCFGGRQRLNTTDLTGEDGRNWQFAVCEPPDRDYTRNFSGTSAATPQVSGVAALMLQANPGLGWRDVKEILLRCGTRVQPADTEWITNSAGVAHNPKFGGGLLNTRRAVELATNWSVLPPMAVLSGSLTNLALPVPDEDPSGVTQTFTFNPGAFRVEQVRLSLWLPHEHRGDLEITLTSPADITSTLASPHLSAGPGYDGWSFTSVRHWGESAQGDWTLRIADLRPGLTGTIEAAHLELLGSEPVRFWMTRSEVALPVLHADFSAPGWGCREFAFEASTNLIHWTTLQAQTLCDGGTLEYTDTEAVNFPYRFYRLRW